jgi:hypothetical protein
MTPAPKKNQPSTILRLVLLIGFCVTALLAYRVLVGTLQIGGVGAGAAIALLAGILIAIGYRWYDSRQKRSRFEAVIAAHTHEVDDDDGQPMPDDPHRIRKQVYDLTPSDLRADGIWEHALDEEGIEGQDEATVRPRPDLGQADPREGLLIARSMFQAADGTQYVGYAYPSEDQSPGFVQPTIVTEDGQVNFWLGAHDAVEPDDLRPLYVLLGKTSDELFPVTYRADVPTSPLPLEGTIRGFSWRTSRSDAPRESR